MQPPYPPPGSMTNTFKQQTIQYTNNLGNNLQNQFNVAEDYARQQYIAGIGQIDSARNTFHNNINNFASQGQIIENQMKSLPGQINNGLSNAVNPRLANLGNDLAPKAMEYIQDLKTNNMNASNYPNPPMNQINQLPQIPSLESERALNTKYSIPNIGISPPPIPSSSKPNNGFCSCCVSICPSLCGDNNQSIRMPTSPSGKSSRYQNNSNPCSCFGNCCSSLCGPGFCSNCCGNI